ncbi:unnamed protein product [Urochloa decumbens]|uniref:Uncharacterized protein n=1 Tax=Urochloa decumbens TaxID=240449 RepID=A0ABC8YWQ9_9POAL
MGNAAAMPSAFPAAPLATPTIKLLIAKDAQVVVFAEAGKDAVDFLLGLLVMPLAKMFSLLGIGKEKDMPLAALANLYASVHRMDPEYIQSPETRAALLNPAPADPALASAARGYPSLVQPPPPPSPPAHLPAPARPLPNGTCRAPSSSLLSPLPPGLSSSLKGMARPPPFNFGGGGGAYQCSDAAYLTDKQEQERRGFVRGLVTYTVMDDLSLTPMSNISTIARLHALGVDYSALEERTVKIGYQEGLEILNASLRDSKTVLTDVFLAKKKEKRARTAGDKNGATSQQQEKKARNDPAAGKELATE